MTESKLRYFEGLGWRIQMGRQLREDTLHGRGTVCVFSKISFLFIGSSRSMALRPRNVEEFESSVGLMGSFESGSMVTRSGDVITVEQANLFGQEWQVNDKDPQLFVEKRFPQWPQQCILPVKKVENNGDTATVRHRRLTGSTMSQEQAEFACAAWGEDVKNCVKDVMATGDLELAEAGSY